GFSRVETPLFESMLVVRDVAEEAEVQVPTQGDNVQEPAAEEVVPSTPALSSPSLPPHQPPYPPQPQDAEGLENDKAAQQLEIVKLKARVKKLEKINKAEIYNIDLDHSSKVLSMQEDDTEVQVAVEIINTTKFLTEVVTATATQVIAASTPIPAAKPKILNIAATLAVSTRRRKGVVIRDPEEEL
nr:hypothetical protein [Tanacetum cinerariifolium]